MDKTNKTWYAVVNPSAGSGKTLAKWRDAEKLLYDRQIKYKFTTPESKSDSSIRISMACREGYRRFIAVGGDGTVHQLLSRIAKFVDAEVANGRDVKLEDFTLVVLPIGSGNDWLRSHNIPHDHKAIIDLIAEEKFAQQDVIKAEILNPEDRSVIKTAYMANVGGYSFDANVCEVVNFQKSHGITGKFMYINALKRLASRQKAARTKMICDGKLVFDDLLYTISFGNGRYSGGGLCQTPSAIMDDGLLEIMLAPKFSIWRVFVNIKKLLESRTEEIRFLKFFKAKDIILEPYGQGELVEIDGDVIGRAPLHLHVMDSRINVLHLEPCND